jgi:hypothetical protein
MHFAAPGDAPRLTDAVYLELHFAHDLQVELRCEAYRMLRGSAQCLEKVVLQPRNAWLFHSSTTKHFDELEGLQQLVVVAIYLSNPIFFQKLLPLP